MSSDLVGEAGVALFTSIVMTSQGNYVRRQSESDVGIDLHVDVAADDGKPSGRLLGIQVKSGPSQFSHPTEGGWTYYFDDSHANRWFEHSLPVIITLVDVEAGHAYWAQVSRATVGKTATRWKIFVPRDSSVSSAGSRWSELASRPDQRALDVLQTSLDALPPPTTAALAEASQSRGVEAALLAMTLADRGAEPSKTVESLLDAPPHWFLDLEDTAWATLASFSACHEEWRLSATCFELAASLNLGRAGHFLSCAALNLMSHDLTRAANLLELARDHDGDPFLAKVAAALFEYHKGARAAPDLGPILADSRWTTSAAARTLVGQQHLRAGDWTKAIAEYRVALTIEPNNLNAPRLLASALINRFHGPESGPADLAEAIDLLIAQVEGAHKWRGPTHATLPLLLRALSFGERWQQVLRWGASPPIGEARPGESQHGETAIFTTAAALALNDRERAESLAEGLPDEPRAQLIRLEMEGQPVAQSTLIAVWIAELDAAEKQGDHQRMVEAVLRLASHGVDRSNDLDSLVRAGSIAGDVRDLCRCVASAASDFDGCLPELRTLSRRSVIAAEVGGNLARRAGRLDLALEFARRGSQVFRHPKFLVAEFDCHLAADDHAEADTTASRMVSEDRLGPVQRARALRYMAERAGGDGNWSLTEERMQRVIAVSPLVLDEDVWRLTASQANAGEYKRAVQTLREYSPEVLDEESAVIWLAVMSQVAWSDDEVNTALDLAERFNHAHDLVSALITHVVTTTRSRPGEADVSGSTTSGSEVTIDPALHKRAFTLLDSLIASGGSEYGAKFVASDPEQSVEQVKDLLRDTALADQADLSGIEEAVREGIIPLGVVLEARGHSHSKELLSGNWRAILAAPYSATQHSKERESARAALGGAVVLEITTLVTLAALSRRDELLGRFPNIRMARSARHDIARARTQVFADTASSGHLWFDPKSESFMRSERTEEDRRELEVKIVALEEIAAHCELVSDPPLDVLGDRIEEEGSDLDGPWIGAIKVAKALGLPLWSDDIATRSIAESRGVGSFSTPALIEEIDLERIAQAVGDDPRQDAALKAHDAALIEMMSSGVVDLPLRASHIVHAAEADEWRPGLAAMPLSRRAWWLWTNTVFRDYERILRAVQGAAPEHSEQWRLTAVAGAIDIVPASVSAARSVAVGIALVGHDGDADSALAEVDRIEQAIGRPEFADLRASLDDALSVLVRSKVKSEDDPMVLTLRRHVLSMTSESRASEAV